MLQYRMRRSRLGRVRASMHLPRVYSRITLEITDVRVQRVQEISEEDAEAEGVYAWADMGRLDICARPLFHDLWDSINGKTHPWANNDWVWGTIVQCRLTNTK